MPSLVHEAPLVVLREHPALVPALLRESLDVALPGFVSVDVGDPGFTQALPAEFRADLVVHLRGGPPDHAPVMGVVVEVQRARDDAKRRSWPCYVAALHARLRCPTCLVVIATDDATARWAATPIASLQPGSPFTPLVLGPGRIPRVTRARARDEPWMAVLSALTHGNGPDGTAVTLAAFAALDVLPALEATVCYDLIRASLDEVARRALEDEMQSGKYEYQSDFARRYYGEGRQEGRQEGLQEGRQQGLLDGARQLVLALADRHGQVGDDARARVGACGDPAQLQELAVALAGAADRAAVERLLARLAAADVTAG
ncbi:MAG: Yae1 family protein [Kofleriaceae bacterium]